MQLWSGELVMINVEDQKHPPFDACQARIVVSMGNHFTFEMIFFALTTID
jgi:hypothetical protein